MKSKEVNGLYNCTYCICPVCGDDGLSGNYCDKCGQRLDGLTVVVKGEWTNG